MAPDAVRLKPEHLDGIRASVDWQAMSGGRCFDFPNGEDGGVIELIRKLDTAIVSRPGTLFRNMAGRMPRLI